MVEGANSENPEELLKEGQAFEAGIVSGVENAPDPDQGEVRTHEVPQEDVPEEYDDKDRPQSFLAFSYHCRAFFHACLSQGLNPNCDSCCVQRIPNHSSLRRSWHTAHEGQCPSRQE